MENLPEKEESKIYFLLTKWHLLLIYAMGWIIGFIFLLIFIGMGSSLKINFSYEGLFFGFIALVIICVLPLIWLFRYLDKKLLRLIINEDCQILAKVKELARENQGQDADVK